MTGQHLQPGMAQPAECPSRLAVKGILIVSVDLGGSIQSLSLALTRCLAMFAVFVKLRQGLGTMSFSVSVSLRLDLIVCKSRSGV